MKKGLGFGLELKEQKFCTDIHPLSLFDPIGRRSMGITILLQKVDAIHVLKNVVYVKTKIKYTNE